MVFDDALEVARGTAERVRPALEARIERWLQVYGPVPGRKSDAPLTTDFCVGGASALLSVLRGELPDLTWRYAGSYGRGCGGMFDAAGLLRGHYWVEGRTDDGSAMIVDVTADQFGHGEIVVVPVGDARYVDAMPHGFPEADVRSEAEWNFGLSVADTMEPVGPVASFG